MLVATHRAAVELSALRRTDASAEWRQQRRPALLECELERLAVVSPVTDQADEATTDESLSDGPEREWRLMSRTTLNPNGDRKTMAVCNCHDLGC